jgi:hypothetical protein
MKKPIQRCNLASLRWVNPVGWLSVGLIFLSGWVAQCQSFPSQSPPGQSVQSVSGQFIITSSGSSSTSDLPMARNSQEAAAIRLEPALLSVMAERIKDSIWHLMGVPGGAQWQGNITLALRAARRRDESAPISASRGMRGWNYRVDLPDVLQKSQFVRVMTSVVLFELAEHNDVAPLQPTELPAWLVDGITQQLEAGEVRDLLVASPGQLMNGLPQSRQDTKQHGLDALVAARQILKQSAPLTFAQMSWPSDDQLAGNDGGIYQASSQVFVHELLALSDGSARMNMFITRLPQYENWQTAFQDVYQPYFQRPLDVEKWWTLRVISFLSRDPGPAWTPAVSRERLDEILTIPVEIRASSNSLPAHTALSFQQVILKVNYNQQEAVFNAKMGELGIAEIRLIPSLAGFAYGYRQVLAAYLGQDGDIPVRQSGKVSRPRAGVRETLNKLNALDGRRRVIEARIKPDVWNSGLN